MDLPAGLRAVGHFQGRPIDLHDPVCTSLPRCIIWPLCLHLSNEQAVKTDFGGGDWRDLAEFIRLPSRMIAMIEDYRGDKTKAFTLLYLWDRGIPRNPGTLLKLIIAMDKIGFADYYLREPLQGEQATMSLYYYIYYIDCFDFRAIKEYTQSLSPEDIQKMFPILDITDIHWDEQLESSVISSSCSNDREDTEAAPGAADSRRRTCKYKNCFFLSESN